MQPLVCGTVFHRTSLLPHLSPSFAVVLNHISSLSYPAFWLSSHLYSVGAVTRLNNLIAITVNILTFKRRWVAIWDQFMIKKNTENDFRQFGMGSWPLRRHDNTRCVIRSTVLDSHWPTFIIKTINQPINDNTSTWPANQRPALLLVITILHGHKVDYCNSLLARIVGRKCQFFPVTVHNKWHRKCLCFRRGNWTTSRRCSEKVPQCAATAARCVVR